MKDIEFWFSIGSTYSYLSVARLPALERNTGVTFSWHPFSVRKIMQEMDNIPFPPTKKAKADYMWRDIERRAQKYDIPASVPAPYPLQEFDLANKIASAWNAGRVVCRLRLRYLPQVVSGRTRSGQ